MNNSQKNEKMVLTSGEAETNPPEPTPSPLERHAYAAAARERLLTAKNEAFPRSQQYRPAGDKTGSVGSGEG